MRLAPPLKPVRSMRDRPRVLELRDRDLAADERQPALRRRRVRVERHLEIGVDRRAHAVDRRDVELPAGDGRARDAELSALERHARGHVDVAAEEVAGRARDARLVLVGLDVDLDVGDAAGQALDPELAAAHLEPTVEVRLRSDCPRPSPSR